MSGLPSGIDVDILKGSMENFGEVRHVNHSKSGSETIVLFFSREAAESAERYLSENGFQAIPGVQEMLDARTRAGRGVAFVQMSHECCPPKSETGNVGGYNGHYWPSLENMLNCMEGVFEQESFLQKAKQDLAELKNQDADQQKVCALLLELGERLLREGRAVSDTAAMDVWLETMRLFAAGNLTQHCDRFADTSVNELLACLDDNFGSLADAWAETE